MIFHTIRTLFEDRHHCIKVGREGGKTPIIRDVKEKVRNMFDIKLLNLIEGSGRDREYGIDTVNGYKAVGGRVCYRH